MNPARPPDLPEFDEPPVTEVYLSLQFKPLPALTAAHVGLLWTEFRSEFPRVEQRPPVISEVEAFGPPAKPQVRILISQPDEPVDAPWRFWFIDDSGNELIQVQKDRLIHNWRKVTGTEVYPRYETIRSKFESDLRRFEAFVDTEGLGSIVPVQCEIQYLNHIVAGQGWQNHSEVSRVVTKWGGTYSEEFLPEPEDALLNFRYRIPDPDGSPIGRLRVKVQPAIRDRDQVPMIVLSMTARGLIPDAAMAGVLEFFDEGRRWIVRGFTALTTPEMHRIWKRSK
jgi:uncharacterized protein (TIGR04255 family)